MGKYRKRRYKKSRFKPKRGIRTFRDLYVYEKSSSSAVAVRKFINQLKEKSKKEEEYLDEELLEKLDKTVSKIPLLLARAHSRRFSNEGVEILDDAMEFCDRSVVYLEQAGKAHSSVEQGSGRGFYC